MKDIKVLTVVSHSDQLSGDSYRVTINPCNVDYVMSSEPMVVIHGMVLYRTLVKFSQNGSAELNITKSDLHTLEAAIGLYDYEDEF